MVSAVLVKLAGTFSKAAPRSSLPGRQAGEQPAGRGRRLLASLVCACSSRVSQIGDERAAAAAARQRQMKWIDVGGEARGEEGVVVVGGFSLSYGVDLSL